ncbi:hypothetical protein ER308_16975 [Egibacter rhizosphaerae]|uniref:TIGR02611 family protein n=1 Tax=Egibacter rhizosphaerae TaxID=1670831 RepID=A0A411YIK3_9ACTN|nr:PGPGW domain-containing protein [Egibacter rhizosphaerae]QBI21098.1 hypothetical protein ER308_16975 [Egibacter rhizosphaerae]
MDRESTRWVDRKIGRARGLVDSHGKVFRVMWVAVGVIVVAAGLAMTVFPGPVTVVVPLGLAMLAAVFGWARWLLLRTVEHGTEAKERFDRASLWVKALTVAASAAIAAAVLALMLL